MTSLANALRSAEHVLGITRVSGRAIDTSSPYPAKADEVIARMGKLMIGMVQEVLSVIAQLRTQESLSILWGRLLEEPAVVPTPADLALKSVAPFRDIQRITQEEGKWAINIWYSEIIRCAKYSTDLRTMSSLDAINELENYLRKYSDDVTSLSKHPVPLQIARGYHTASGFTWNLACAIIISYRVQYGEVIDVEEFCAIWRNTWQDIVACATTNQLLFTALLTILFENSEVMTIRNDIVRLVSVDGGLQLDFQDKALSNLKSVARQLKAHKRVITSCPALRVNSELGESGVHFLFNDVQQIACNLLIPCLKLCWKFKET